MKNIAAALSVGLIIALVFGCGNLSSQDLSYGKAKNFTLPDIYKDEVKLSDYSGKIIILNFFATWCPPCRTEMPDFNEIARLYKGKAEVIAVNVGGENVSKVSKFVRDNNLNFKVLIDDGTASKLYGPVTAIPVTFIIDKNFNIVEKYVGSRTKEVFESKIKELLAE